MEFALVSLATAFVLKKFMSGGNGATVETMSTIEELAGDTKPSMMADVKITPESTITPDREAFLENARPEQQIPGAAQNTMNIPQNYSLPRTEVESRQIPEIGLFDEPAFTRKYEKERLAGLSMNTIRDYRDAKGDIPQTYSTGQQAPIRQTPIEAIVEQTSVQDYWNHEPHVVRINDDVNDKAEKRDALGRSYAVTPQDVPPSFITRPIDVLRRNIDEENTHLKPTINNDIQRPILSAQTVDMGKDKDRAIQRVHTTITQTHTGSDLYPRVQNTRSSEYARKLELAQLNRPIITPQWSGPSTYHNPIIPVPKLKEDSSVFVARPGVQGNRGWRQFHMIDSFRRLQDDPISERIPVKSKQETPFNNYIKTEYQTARKPGDRIETTPNWMAAYGGELAMKRYTEPPSRGLAPGGAKSESIPDDTITL